MGFLDDMISRTITSKVAPGSGNTAQSKGQKSNSNSKSAKSMTKRNTTLIMQYDEAYYNGMIRKGKEYSICYSIPNVTFRGLSDAKQRDVMENFVGILNSFDAYLKITLVIANIRENKDISKMVHYPIDSYPVYAEEINQMFARNLAAHNSVTTYKLFVIKGSFDNPVDANNQFSTIVHTLDDLFTQAWEIKGEMMSIGKRLHLISCILNKDEYNPYLKYIKEEDEYKVDADLLKKQHLTVDNIIAPNYLKLELKDFALNDRVGRSYYLSKIGNSISTDFLYSIYSIDAEMVIAIDMNGIESGEAIRRLNNKYTQILAEVESKDGFQTLEQVSEQESILDMQDAILNKDEKSYNASIILTLFSENKDTLKDLQQQVYAKAKRHTCAFDPIFASQKYGLQTCCLMGFYNIEFKRFFDAHSLGAFIPFDVPEYFDGDGIYYGLHRINNLPIFYDRNKNDNYNALVLGKSGSGKSFFVKREILFTRLRYPKDNIYIIDPDGEYTYITERLGGEVINLQAGNGVYLNPLDLNMDNSQDKNVNPVTDKSDLIASLVETMMGGGIVLNAKSKSILDRCVKQIYTPYLDHLNLLPPDRYGNKVTIDKNACPTLQDLYDQLMHQKEAEAQEIAISIETYIRGSFDTFAHRTNINTDNTFIDFNIQGLGSNMMDLGLRICMSELWNRMIANRAKGIWTRMYIDEFHNLLGTELSANFCKKLWKQARKWQGAPTGITQNTEDLLQSTAARAIINNSGLVILLGQSELDQEVLAQILHLDDADIRYINKVKPGSGLIVTNSLTIPFYDEFPENTECFKLLNTSPNKKKEKHGDEDEDAA
jgi:hypothetical protein